MFWKVRLRLLLIQALEQFDQVSEVSKQPKNVGGQILTEYHPKLFEKLMQLMTDSEVDFIFQHPIYQMISQH